MAEVETIWNHLKNDWQIKRRDIVDLGIDPNKEWEEITLRELSRLSSFLDVLVSDITKY